MTDFLSSLPGIATLVFSVSSMLSIGFSYTVRQVIDPLRDVPLVAGALGANFVLVPLLSYSIMEFMALGEARGAGLFLVAVAAGAPFVIKLVQAADRDIALTSGLLVLLLVATIVLMPVVVPLALPDAHVSPIAIARPLVLTMLLPLVTGLALNALVPARAARLRPYLSTISTVALVALLVSTVLADFGDLLEVFGTGAFLAALLFVAGAFASGYLVRLTDRDTRNELGLVTAQRNIAAATVVATQDFGDPDTLVMVVVTLVVTMIILFPFVRVLRRRGERGARP